MNKIDKFDENVAELLCGYFEGKDTHGFNPLDYIHAFGSPIAALLYSRLFWPGFVELDGMIFLNSTVENEDDVARVRNTLRQYGGDKRKTEMAFNLIEVPALFGGRSGETTDAQDVWLAETLAEMWKSRLHSMFPDKRFQVSIVHPEESGAELSVLFHRCTGDRTDDSDDSQP